MKTEFLLFLSVACTLILILAALFYPKNKKSSKQLIVVTVALSATMLWGSYAVMTKNYLAALAFLVLVTTTFTSIFRL